MVALLARHFTRLQADPETATASSVSGGDAFGWFANYRLRSGRLEIQAAGSGRGGLSFELENGAPLSVDLTTVLNCGLQVWMASPRVVRTRGGGLGFVILDDWWFPDGYRV